MALRHLKLKLVLLFFLHSYGLSLERRRSAIFRPFGFRSGIRGGPAAGFAATHGLDAAALEVADRQSAGYIRAGETAAAAPYFTTRGYRPGAWRTIAHALVSHGVHQHRRRDLSGNIAAAGTGIAAG